MKNIFLTVCAAVVCALFFFSCEKETEEMEILPVTPPGLNDYYGFKVKDTTGINVKTISSVKGGDFVFLLGLKFGAIWVGRFDINTKEQLEEWNSTERFSESICRLQPLNQGFTKVKDRYVAAFDVKFNNNNNSNIDINNIYRIMLFLNSKDNSVKYSKRNTYNYSIEVYNDVLFLPYFGFRSDLKVGDIYSLENDTIVLSSASQHITGDSIFFSGFHNEKLQFRLFDKRTKKQIKEWHGQEKFNRDIKVYEGYGEYSNFHVDFLDIPDSQWMINTSWGIAVIPEYKQKNPNIDYSPLSLRGDLFFLNDNKAICYHLDEENSYVNMMKEWYKESILIEINSRNNSERKYLVLSPEGAVIEELSSGSYPELLNDKFLVPISYTEGIRLGRKEGYDQAVHRVNYKTGETVWSTLIEPIKEIKEFEGKWTKKLIDSSTKDWIYQIEVLFYDGSKKQVKFSINIDTGKIQYL